jgi:hypothetical protein
MQRRSTSASLPLAVWWMTYPEIENEKKPSSAEGALAEVTGYVAAHRER